MDKESYFQERQILFFIRQIVIGIGALHEKGYVHKDIKFMNVLLDIDNQNVKPLVCDFGLAEEIFDEPMKQTGCGTQTTWAPEVAARKESKLSADWWSVGIVLYQLMYMRTPFESVTLKIK